MQESRKDDETLVKQIFDRLGKLDVLEQRISDMKERITEDIKSLRDDVKSIKSEMITRSEYDRKGNTGKLAALQRELSDFKSSIKDYINEQVENASKKSETSADKKWYQANGWITFLVTTLVSLLTTTIFFLLSHFLGK